MTMHEDAKIWNKVYPIFRRMGMGVPLGVPIDKSAEQFVKGLEKRIKRTVEANCLIVGAIECIEDRKDYRLAVEKLREAERLTDE